MFPRHCSNNSKTAGDTVLVQALAALLDKARDASAGVPAWLGIRWCVQLCWHHDKGGVAVWKQPGCRYCKVACKYQTPPLCVPGHHTNCDQSVTNGPSDVAAAALL